MGIVVSRREAERSLPMCLEVSNGQRAALLHQADDMADDGAAVTFTPKPGLGGRGGAVGVIPRSVEPGDVQGHTYTGISAPKCTFMNKQTKTIPQFASEAQERAYWETHDSTAHLDWAQAKKVTLPHLKPTTKTISLRLPQHLLDSLKVAANARDVPYQSLIKVWLQEKLHGH